MQFTREQARNLHYREIHKDMLRKDKKNNLFVQLRERYPSGTFDGKKFPEYVKTLEEEIAQENNK